MNDADEKLLAQIHEQLSRSGKPPTNSLSEAELVQAEAQLGFPLPPLLRKIYLEVENGALGLSPLYGHLQDLTMPLVDSYVGLRSESGDRRSGQKIWPEKLLIIYDHGCNVYSCLDCADPDYRVLLNDNNKDRDLYALEAPTFRQWLQALIAGTRFDWNAAKKFQL